MPAPNTRRPQPLPNLSDPVVDRHRRFTPTWFRWIKPLLDTTTDLHVNLTATAAEVTANTAAITNEAIVRASADSALAQQTATLTTTVNGNTAALEVLTQSVDGISAQYAVSINLNGRVVGYQRLDGGVTGSTFSVLADKFIVHNPSNDGQSIQAFVIGSVNGVSTVGINGNLIVDGTILARHIAVDSLDALSADIGTVTAGVLQSTDGNFVIDLNNKTITITT